VVWKELPDWIDSRQPEPLAEEGDPGNFSRDRGWNCPRIDSQQPEQKRHGWLDG